MHVFEKKRFSNSSMCYTNFIIYAFKKSNMHFFKFTLSDEIKNNELRKCSLTSILNITFQHFFFFHSEFSDKLKKKLQRNILA